MSSQTPFAPFEDISGLDENQQATLENAYHYSPAIRKVINELHLMDFYLEVLFVNMSKDDRGYFSALSNDGGMLYLRETVDGNLDMTDFSPVIFHAYQYKIMDKSYSSSSLAKTETILFKSLVMSELKIDKVQSKENSDLKLQGSIHTLITEGYDEKVFDNLVAEMNRQNKYSSEEGIQRENLISHFLPKAGPTKMN